MGESDQVLSRPRIALALSGGGFRASIFHLGAIRRLAEMGWLERVDVLSTVSGGSLLGAYAVQRWQDMLQGGGNWLSFDEHIATPFLRLLQTRNFIRDWLIRIPLVPLRKLFDRTYTRTTLASNLYSERFYGNMNCDQLPARPYLIMNATSLQSIRAWRFTRAGLGDSRLGHAA